MGHFFMGHFLIPKMFLTPHYILVSVSCESFSPKNEFTVCARNNNSHRISGPQQACRQFQTLSMGHSSPPKMRLTHIVFCICILSIFFTRTLRTLRQKLLSNLGSPKTRRHLQTFPMVHFVTIEICFTRILFCYLSLIYTS